MKLIIGGAFQGKKEYAKQQFQISQEKCWMGQRHLMTHCFSVPVCFIFMNG